LGRAKEFAAYKATAVLTDKGYVAVPFKSHHGSVPSGEGYDLRTSCPHSLYQGYSRLSEDKRAKVDQKIKDEDVQLRSQLRVNPPTPEMLEQVAKFGRIRSEVLPPQQAAPAPQAAAPTARPTGFTNKYAGNCVGCGTKVGVGEGVTSRGAGGWEVRCVGCHHGSK
jgi:hypothetical protein